MICQNCNKNVKKPLELYTGDWACPLCKKALSVSSIAVVVNRENDETFKLSELCYLRALKCQKDTKRYEKEIGMAIDNCRIAARMGNPKALIRLGYYYEYGYISADLLESFKIAYEYYKLVWNSMPEIAEKPDDPDYNDGCIKLRTAAAWHYLELLKKLPESFRRNGNLSYRDEKSKIKSKGISVPDDESAELAMEEDRVAHVLNVLQSCMSKEKSPLFGIMKLEKGDFEALCAVKDKSNKDDTPKLIRYAQKMLIVIFDMEDSSLQTIKRGEDLQNVSLNKTHYLYFFNEYGAHGISERKCAQIGKALKKGTGMTEYVPVKRIIEAMGKGGGQNDIIFSEDDVLMYRSRLEPFAHATGDLVNSVVNR